MSPIRKIYRGFAPGSALNTGAGATGAGCSPPAWIRQHGMAPVFETARAYTKAIPDLLLAEIFGVTSFELG